LEIQCNPEKDSYVNVPYAQRLERQQFDKGIEALRKKYHFITFDPSQTVLDETENMLRIERGRPLYLDDNHLNDFGSMYFRKAFLPFIQNILADRQKNSQRHTSNIVARSSISVKNPDLAVGISRRQSATR